MRSGFIARLATILAAFAIFATTPALGAKSANQKSYEFYEDALRLFNTKDYRAAIIQLRNALQQDQKNLAARVLLGKTHLRLGDGVSAEKQLTLARTTGADDNLTLVPFGRALLVQGKSARLLKEILPAGRRPDIEAEIRFMRGQAFLDQRQHRKAKESFESALRLDPSHGETLLGMARLNLILGNPERANGYAEKALKVASGDADTWYVAGEIMRTQRKYDVALRHYGSAINLSDQHLPARISRAAVLMDMHRYDDALEDVNYTRGILTRDPQTLYMYAVLMSHKKKVKEADEALRLAANAMEERDPDFIINHPPSLLLKGLIDYSRKRFSEAYPSLSRYVELIPHHVGARKLLGALLLRKKDPAGAVKALEPAAQLAEDDAELMSLLGSAYMLSRQFDKARDVLQRAAIKNPDRAKLQTRLGLSRLALGESDDAIRHLENAVRLDPRIGRAEVMLGLIQIKKRNFRNAVAAADAFQKQNPKSPFPHNLAGAALMREGNLPAARRRFHEALKVDPGYSPAKFNLAALHVAEGKNDLARKLYMELLAANKNDTRVMRELSLLSENEGRIPEAISWLDQIRKLDSNAIVPQIRLLSLFVRTGRVRDGLQIAEEIESLHPRNQAVLEAKAKALIAAGETGKAVETLRQASHLSKNDPDNYFRIARQQLDIQDFEGAKKSLQSTVSLDPGHLAAQSTLVGLEMRQGGAEKALEMAQAVRAAYPKSPVGDLLTGDLLMKTRRYQDAAVAYREGLKKAQGPTLAVRLFQVRRRMGENEPALLELEAWNQQYPGYPMVQRVLASAYMSSGKLDRAEKLYKAYLEKHPADIRIMNNLALLYQQQGKPEALKIAEEARRLAPANPSILDTYGWILVQTGDPSKGLRYLREAQTRAAGQIEVRYHIAVALDRLGRKKEARQELSAILSSNENFRNRKAAQALYDALRK